MRSIKIGDSFYMEGEKIIREEKELDITVKKIIVLGPYVMISFSDKTKMKYWGYPYSVRVDSN